MPHVSIALEQCALLVNDFEEKMVNPASPFYTSDQEAALERLLPLVAFCRAHGIPTVFALIGPERTREKGLLRRELPEGAVEDPAHSRLADRLGSHPQDFVFVKVGASGAISGGPVLQHLRERNRTIAMIAGTTLQFGIDTTARDARNNGLQPVVLSDCCSVLPITDQGWGPVSREDVRRAFLSTIQKGLGRVATAAEVLSELQAQVRS